jgi:hypothetical protein
VPLSCSIVFPLDGLSGAQAGGDDGSMSETGAAESGADAAEAASDVSGDATAEAAAETGGGDGPVEAPAETGGGDGPPITYAQEVLADAPSGYWRLGEATGATTAKDASGKGVDATYHGAVTLQVKGAIAGDADTAAGFDGSTSYADAGNVFQFAGTAACSFEAWLQPTVDTSYHGILSRSDRISAPSEGYLLFVEPAPQPLLAFERIETTTHFTVESSSVATTATWVHMVATYDGTTGLVYFDGVQQGTGPAAFALTGATSNFVIGAEAGGGDVWFLGNLDEVAVYDHVLAASRVLAHYHVGVGQPP